MDPSTEIRNLPLGIKMELNNILDQQESWKKLMSIIPKTLSDNYNCSITCKNLAKYRSEDFRSTENHAITFKVPCTEQLLFKEWGSSGKIRPKLGHLAHLLEEAQLFRAADYVRVDLLKQPRPQRPDKGPAAFVKMNSSELKQLESKRIEKILDEINYPSSAIEIINKSSSTNANLDHSCKDKLPVIPKIVVSKSPDVEEPVPSFQMPVVMQTERSRKEPSDLIKFSTGSADNQSNANLPQLSSLLNNTSGPNHVMPLVIGNSTVSIESQSDDNLPQLTSLLINSDKSEDSPNISEFGGLSLEATGNVPALSELFGNSDPAVESHIKPATSKNSGSSRSCTSPLPNLSLNTLLPHFTYADLEQATNNFDETLLNQGGRFLGAGAFGKVYLAQGLFAQEVAVKKLLLDNVDVVLVDDTVTKQFRNEVEVLSKYKHDNLLSLLGYSCDGCTYCLIYEYIPGGALKDRLQKHELIWTERIYIAKGSAKAVSYLHTAFAMPLIHRDVKSANILLDYNNKPKLCDFGLIKLSPTQNTRTGTTIFGTSAYMAPEAFRGDISIKLDTFSFGVVLIELLTSLPPVDENRQGVDLVTHVEEICEDSIRPLLDVSAGDWKSGGIDFAEELYRIAKNCLEEKKKRPTMAEISEELEKLLQKCL